MLSARLAALALIATLAGAVDGPSQPYLPPPLSTATIAWDLTPDLTDPDRRISLILVGDRVRACFGTQRTVCVLSCDKTPNDVDLEFLAQVSTALAARPEAANPTIGDYRLCWDAPVDDTPATDVPGHPTTRTSDNEPAIVLTRDRHDFLTDIHQRIRIPLADLPRIRALLGQIPALAQRLRAAQTRMIREDSPTTTTR